MAELRVGCSSWTSEAWWDRLYPRKLADADRLGWYARLFDTVEVDSTYYHVPARGVVASWARKTPPDFRFALKLTRELLDPKLPVDREKLATFAQSALALGEKLGPVLLQFPPWVRPGEKTRGFLRELLEALDPRLRYALELRDAGWFRGETLDWVRRELSSRKMAFTWSYLTYVDVPPEVTTDLIYLRFIGDHTSVPTETHGEIRVDRSPELDLWAKRVRAEAERVQRVFVFFNNHFAGFAPVSVNDFRTRMGLPPVDLALPSRRGTLDDLPT